MQFSPICAAPLAGGRLRIDLDAVAANYAAVARATGARVAAVVKADAYGLGAPRVAHRLAQAGCRDFFTALLQEALDLRPILPEDARVHVLNGLPPGAERLCADAGLIPVLNSLAQAQRWVAAAGDRAEAPPAALQLDSGMSRLGLSEAEVDALLAAPDLLAKANIVLVMSHLACADEPADAANAAQGERFARMAARLDLPASRSLGNSAAVFGARALHGDMVRAGLALYGAEPIPGLATPLRPVVGLEAQVIQLRDIPAGARVGYGLTYAAPAPRRLACLSVGYADGWPRRLEGHGRAFIAGVAAPIVGRISMDSTIVDITGLPPGAVAEGDFAELIGPHQSLDHVAAAAGMIAYELLTGFGQRLERRYEDGATAPGGKAA